MPTSTTETGPNWTDIINTALAIWSKNQGSGSTPNFYNVPPTPEEAWRTDATKSLYNTASAFTDQYMRGLGDLNPSFQMPNSATGNPAFMGGVKVPRIDWSKIPPPTTTGASPVPQTPASGPPTSDSGNTGVPGDPFGNIGSPAGGTGDPFANMPGATPEQQAGLGQLSDWLQQHPDIAKGGVDVIAAALGLIGGPLAGVIGMVGDKLFRQWFQNFQKNNAPKDPTLPIKQSPVQPGDLTPSGQPTQIQIDPSTGMWSMQNPSPTQQAWLNQINNFNRNLMNGNPGGGSGVGGTNPGDMINGPTRRGDYP